MLNQIPFIPGPIVRALEMGADIVVTGRTADSALALAPCIHSLGWKFSEYEKMAAGSLAGHLIECGGQVRFNSLFSVLPIWCSPFGYLYFPFSYNRSQYIGIRIHVLLSVKRVIYRLSRHSLAKGFAVFSRGITIVK